MTRYTKSMREAMEEVWANDITLSEGKMKTIATMFADGKSAEEIAKKMKLPVATVKTILGEDDIQEAMLWEFTDTQITKLKKDYESLKGAKISLARANQLRNIFDKITNTQLPKLYRADIPFLSTMALSRMIKKGIQVPKGVKIRAFREDVVDEKFQPGFAVRYLDPKNGKRLVAAYKTKKDADDKAAQLKKDGAKDITITKHDLNFKEEDYNVVNELGATTLKEYAEYIEYMAKNSSQAKAIANMFKGKTGGGESNADGSEVRIDSAKDVESIHKQVVAKYGDDVRVLTKEQDENAINISGVETSGERVNEASNTIYKVKKDGKVVFTGKYNQVLTYRKQHGGEIVTEETEPKKKFGDIKKETTDKNKDAVNIETMKQQLGVLRQKLEIEKHKAVKPQPNKETGEVPLTVGLAHKLLRDKDKKKEGVGEKEKVEEGRVKEYLMDVEQDAADGMDLNKLIRKHYGKMGLTADAIKKIYYRVTNEEVKKSYKTIVNESSHYTSSQVKQAIEIANKSDGNYTGASKQIEKIVKGLSNHKDVANALRKANESLDERDGANTSSRKGSVWRKAKKWRFGMKVGSKEPKGDKELEEIRIRPKRAVESDLSKSQTKKVHKKADDLPKKSFRDQYGKKKGDSVRYAVATKQTKKKIGIENKNHPAKKKWEILTAKKTNKDDNNKDILPHQEPTQKTDPMNIQTKEPEKKRTDNGTKSDKIDVNPRIDYHA